MKDFFKGIGNKFNKDQLLIQKEIRSMQALANLLPFYFPHNHYSIKYNDLEMLVNQLIFFNAENILETGSGLTTLTIAKLFKKLGKGKVIALEQDKDWMELMIKLGKCEGLSDFFEIFFCPTTKINDQNLKGEWYDESIYQEILKSKKFQCFILDGPTANKDYLIHSRVLSYLLIKNYGTPNFLVYLDDYQREGDKLNLETLKSKFDLQVKIKNKFGKGLILSR